MDQSTLVNELIVDGEKLLKRLGEEGVPVTAAGWVKEAESGWWYLYIATPLIAKNWRGIKAAYHRVNTVWREMPEELALHLLGVKLVPPGDPIAKAVLGAQRRGSGAGSLSFGEGGRLIGGVGVEGAYLYPLEGAPA